ncbi:MAG: AI-2E family transporter [Xanthomonadaceae bacterium]|nr:AI-2E family transporter [Xanthomonadaceae bacterium]
MTDTQKWQLLAAIAVLCGLLYWLSPVLTPFAVAALLAWLGDPLVDRLERRRLSRTAAVSVVFGAMTLGLVLVLLVLVPLLEAQISRLIDKLPQVVAWVNTVVLPWVAERTGYSLDQLNPQQLIDALREHWRQAGGVAATVLTSVSKSGLAIVGFVGTLALIPVVAFYFLRDWDDMLSRLRALLPRPLEPTVSTFARESDEVLAAFLRGQLSVMIALGMVYTTGLMLVGLDLAVLIGMLAGVVSFVPYLGIIVGGGAALIAAAVQFQDWLHPGLVLLVFVVGQMLEGFVLTPWLVGDRVGLHPVAVIFAILAGGQLFGFLGVLLALPVAAVLMVALRHAHRRYLASELYGAAAADPAAAPPDAPPPGAPPAGGTPGAPAP